MINNILDTLLKKHRLKFVKNAINKVCITHTDLNKVKRYLVIYGFKSWDSHISMASRFESQKGDVSPITDEFLWRVRHEFNYSVNEFVDSELAKRFGG